MALRTVTLGAGEGSYILNSWIGFQIPNIWGSNSCSLPSITKCLISIFSGIKVIATKDFGANFSLTIASVILNWWEWENNNSNSTLHLNDTLKFISCFLVISFFTFTKKYEKSWRGNWVQGSTNSKIIELGLLGFLKPNLAFFFSLWLSYICNHEGSWERQGLNNEKRVGENGEAKLWFILLLSSFISSTSLVSFPLPAQISVLKDMPSRYWKIVW